MLKKGPSIQSTTTTKTKIMRCKAGVAVTCIAIATGLPPYGWIFIGQFSMVAGTGHSNNRKGTTHFYWLEEIASWSDRRIGPISTLNRSRTSTPPEYYHCYEAAAPTASRIHVIVSKRGRGRYRWTLVWYPTLISMKPFDSLTREALIQVTSVSAKKHLVLSQ